MDEKPLVFKHVRGGKEFAPADLPKLPPAALRVMLGKLRDRGLAGDRVDAATFAEFSADMAVDMVALALRRMDPTITPRDVAEDEDYDMVLRAYTHIQNANPLLFPPDGQVVPEAGDQAAKKVS